MNIKKICGKDLTNDQKKEVSNFLYEHLDEFRDSLEDICSCLDYVTNDQDGGDVFIAEVDGNIAGSVVVNRTGMAKFIPENILVYIAVDTKYRGQGMGKKLMNFVIKHTQGNIALHVEPNNPAVHLYKNLGFTNKYLEMRFLKN